MLPNGEVRIANAGHLAPYSDGREVEVEAGLPLGVVADVEYPESLTTGDRFTFLSDGVLEAANAAHELFGFERSRQISIQPAAAIAQAAQTWGQNDDITVVTVRRTA
jgi:serine phosphatase RsbU (regulator of sigma subunit)